MPPLLLLLAGMTVVVGGILLLRLHAFVALLLGALLVAALTPAAAIEAEAVRRGRTPAAAAALAATPAVERVVQGFGNTAGQLGVMVAMASIIGAALLHSGAAERIVRGMLAVVGEARAGLSFLGGGFLLGIPVFFDTVFYLLVPLAKAMRLRTGGHYLLYVLGIVAGGTMTHSLVPPTPGPLFVANELGVGLGMMILGGCGVAAFAGTAGFAFARWADARWPTPLRESPEVLATLEQIATRDTRQLPNLFASLAPILLPVVLIASQALVTVDGTAADAGTAAFWLRRLGDRNIALVLSAAIAFFLLIRRGTRATTASAVEEALASAGVIVLITGAGGAFGAVLQQSGIGHVMQELASAYSIPVLPLAFLLTALVRTALGSATVAMITAAGALAGMANAAALGFHPLYLALAIGCGSKPVWWMNDSGFWVIAKLSGLREHEALRALTTMSCVTGLTGLLATMIAAWFWPLV